ncbi:hypothetical protein ACEPPN_015197 [Leptodophora sp. 'Broadleaf-Isolate-01']
MVDNTLNYAPLDRSRREIRLLKRESESWIASPAEIYYGFYFQHVSLDENPDFVALSYTWGPKEPPIQVLMYDASPTGGKTVQTVQITENLAHSLDELISFAAERPLWIDAICINQENEEEKSWQVALMRYIYSSASSVFIWLGPDEEDGGSALARLDEVGRQVYHEPWLVKFEVDYWYSMYAGQEFPSEVFSSLFHFHGDDKTLEQLIGEHSVSNQVNASIPFSRTKILLQRPWWQRIWVLQEVVLPIMDSKTHRGAKARDVVFACGTSRSCLLHLAPALTLFRLHELASTGTLYFVENNTTVRWIDPRPFLMLSARVWGRRISLTQLLMSTSRYTSANQRLCSSDARDRIFGLLGICSDADQLGIFPDYTISCTRLYTQVAATLIRNYSLDTVLNSHFPKMMVELPSWVPDWSAESKGYAIHLQDETIEHGFDKYMCNVTPCFVPWPSGDRFKNDVIFKDEETVLVVRGSCVGGKIGGIIPDSAWQDFLTTAAKFLGPSKNPPSILLNQGFKVAESQEQAEARKAARRRYQSRGVTFTVPNSGLNDVDPLLQESSSDLRYTLETFRDQPYLDLEYLSADNAVPILRCISKLHANLRELCNAQKNSNAYPNAKSLENAIWRAPVADQGKEDETGWKRPSKDVRSAVMFLDIIANGSPDSFAEACPRGFDDLVTDSQLERAHYILTTSGMFVGELKLRTARFLRWPTNNQAIGVFSLDGEVSMGVLRHEGDGKAEDDFCSILYKPLDELAVILCQLHALEGRDYKNPKDVKRDRTSGAILPKEITDAAVRETHRAFAISNDEVGGLFFETQKYLKEVIVQSIGRKCFATTDGFLGLGSSQMEIGDIVAAWPGMSGLVLLRPLKNGRWKYVGEAYILGAMDGELTANKRTRHEPYEFEVE